MPMDNRFLGTSFLSFLATALFVTFIATGFIALFIRQPLGPNDLFASVQMATVRIFGAGAVLVGIFGLLLARSVTILIEIEKNTRGVLLRMSSETASHEGPK